MTSMDDAFATQANVELIYPLFQNFEKKLANTFANPECEIGCCSGCYGCC
jgi:hypothetical protein